MPDKGRINNQMLWDRCPLCEQANHCQVDNPGGCWCKTASIPATALDRARTINPERNRCICQSCLNRHAMDSPTSPDADIQKR